MKTTRMFKKTTWLAVCLTALLVASGCSSPVQGSGALYLTDKDKIKCINVDSVTFWGSRYTTYTVDGKDFSTQSALEYFPNILCN